MESSSDEDDQLPIDRPKQTFIRKPTKRRTQVHPETPVSTENRYRIPVIPPIGERYTPTAHSETMKFQGFSQQQEVALAVMEAHLQESDETLADLRRKWVEDSADILQGTPTGLPPFREVNHKIPLIDENMRHKHYLPRCPDSLKSQLLDKIQLYTSNGWWEESNVPQAAPMLCVPKKSGKLRTVIDGRKQNDNIQKDVTPFPDQEEIRNDVARAKY